MPLSRHDLKVAINVCMLPHIWGGVAHAALGLIHALGKLEDGKETYYLIVESDEQIDWIKPYLGQNQRITDRRDWSERRKNLTRATSRPLAARLIGQTFTRVRNLLHTLEDHSEPQQYAWPTIPLSDGFYENLGCHVLHQPSQWFILCAMPTVYNPHDLQHLHYPQFFTAFELARRETVYPAGCHFAHTVVAGTQWIKDDLIRHYRLDAGKIQVIPWAAPTISYRPPVPEDIDRVRDKYQLQQPFVIYPAAAWPHKNHLRLLEAIAYLRDRADMQIQLICTGSIQDSYWLYFWPQIEQRLQDLHLSSQVRFLGYLPESDVRPIYQLSQFLILPSLFEADSCPVHEAWVDGVPVACSNAAALPDQVHDAALLFDPTSVESIADAIATMAKSQDLREHLRQRGYSRMRDFDWQRTAKAYRAVYRRAARFALTDEDSWLLGWDWMKTPEREQAFRVSDTNVSNARP